MVIPILSCKGPFGGGILCHVILFPGQPFLKLCLILLYARSPVRTHNEVLKAAEINMAVAMGVILQIVLVVILCRIKIPQRFKFHGQRLAVILLNFIHDSLDGAAILITGIVDAGPVLTSSVVSLPVYADRVDDFEKLSDQYAQCNNVRIVHNTDCFSKPGGV